MSTINGQFKPGDRVKVKFEDRPGHLRTPWYVRGKAGWIEKVYGDFLNPELLAFGKDGLPKQKDVPKEMGGSGVLMAE